MSAPLDLYHGATSVCQAGILTRIRLLFRMPDKVKCVVVIRLSSAGAANSHSKH